MANENLTHMARFPFHKTQCNRTEAIPRRQEHAWALGKLQRLFQALGSASKQSSLFLGYPTRQQAKQRFLLLLFPGSSSRECSKAQL